MTSNHLVRFRSTSPRKNLPPSISRKRAEANFLCSFERAFVAEHCQTKQITWRDFALQGYGIPDLISPLHGALSKTKPPCCRLRRFDRSYNASSLLHLNSNCATGAKALYRHTDTGTSATAQSLSFREMLPRGPLSVWNFSWGQLKAEQRGCGHHHLGVAVGVGVAHSGIEFGVVLQ